MGFVIRFFQGNETLYRHVSDVTEEGDIIAAHDEAFREFRKRFPDITLWEGNITVGYEKA